MIFLYLLFKINETMKQNKTNAFLKSL